ncbi:MAG: D-2-hydroxyacid dehydrogenase [Tissierellales bacterium]|jgi:D-3-phosphoglycerate dehydrogenase|nr:D-2-hydroxyacid dehydrogenase [Tissierellales bacterium]
MAIILANDAMDQDAAKALIERGHDLIEHHYEIDELKEKIKEVDIIIVRSATKIREELIDEASKGGKLKLIIRAGVGLDNIDVDYAKSKGIKVRNTPNSSSRAVAELAIGQMISLARYTYIANVTMRDGQWNKKQYKGSELLDKKLGLIGFGRIAKETAHLGELLGMKILYTNRSGPKDGYDNYQYKEMDDLLKESDFISLHVPFNKEQGAVISEDEFKKMKDGVFLVNCARGGVVDEAALLEALESGKVAAAAVDVFEEEPTPNEKLYTHPKVALTPHIGGSTKEAQARIGDEIVSTVDELF